MKFEQQILKSQQDQLNHINSMIDWSLDDLILKARSGVYANTPENRKLGRVGQKYGTKKEEEKKDESISKKQREKNFKEWFGDSKVVDENGKPLVVYHGADEGFDEFDESFMGSSGFDESKVGFHFTNDKSVAAHYAGGVRNFKDVKIKNTWTSIKDQDTRDLDLNPVIGAFYLKIQKPIILTVGEDINDYWVSNSIINAIYDIRERASKYIGKVSNNTIIDAASKQWPGVWEDDKIIKLLKNKIGKLYSLPDGIIIKKVRWDNGTLNDQFITLEPNQIKSATGNKGTFDKNSNDITKSK